MTAPSEIFPIIRKDGQKIVPNYPDVDMALCHILQKINFRTDNESKQLIKLLDLRCRRVIIYETDSQMPKETVMYVVGPEATIESIPGEVYAQKENGVPMVHFVVAGESSGDTCWQYDVPVNFKNTRGNGMLISTFNTQGEYTLASAHSDDEPISRCLFVGVTGMHVGMFGAVQSGVTGLVVVEST
jgi:hypothetical protein